MGSIAGDDVGGGGGGKEEERILVSVRVRPLNVKEIERSEVSDWECINSNTLIFKNSVNPSAFTFDRVFGCDSSTKEVYEEGAKEVALSVVSGINSSIFAYGQTSSGKTYTMSGITEYSVSEIYEYIHKHEEREFVLKFSAMEIYNESVKDLLNPDIGPLRLLDDPEKGTVVDKLTEETLRDEEHLRELLSFCEAERQIGETYLNELSSRSHQILRLSIESSAKEFYGKDNFSTLSASVNFVDLAGSERASQALTAGSRLKEGCHINRSLLTLGTVIRKLSKGRNGHVPYRDSKLTRILQSSLGGNARTAIICTMSPARSHIEQSKNTLQFASCAKEVATNAHVNIVMSDKALVKKLRRELARLEEELRYMGSASSTVPSDILREKDAQIKKMENEMKEILQQRDLAQSRLDDLLRVVENDQHSGQLEFCQSSISHASHSYEDTLSISEESGITYQIPVNETPSFDENESGAVNQISVNETPSFDEQESGGTYQSPFSEAPSLDENCEEVRCIEMIEPSLNSIEDFSLLQTEDSDSRLPPAVNSHKHSDQEPPLLLTLERENQKPLIIDAQGRGFLRERVALAKSTKLRKSRSCRASLMTTGTSSPWFEELEEIENTPPSKLFKDLSKLPRGLRKTIAPVRYEQSGHGSDNNEADTNDDVLKPKNTKNPPDGNTMRLSGYGLEKEEENANDDVLKQKNTKNSPDGNTMRLSMSVDGLKEVAHIQYQKELADDQDCGIKITVKDVCLDPVLESAESPMRWKLEFEKKQREIVELWNTCNVSLIHRSYFFLLIKGEPADAIYMEVEHRRLNFLRNSSSQGSLEENANRELSLKNLRREREKLSRLMKRLPVAERESLYTKWDIALDSKQRRNQLCRRLWNDTIDMEHAKESAMLVAKLFGLIEPGPVPKELFGLSFTPKMSPRNSFSCMYR